MTSNDLHDTRSIQGLEGDRVLQGQRLEPSASLLREFRNGLANQAFQSIAAGLIGKDSTIDGPFGEKKLVYADYVASGRALQQVERFISDKVLPYYANSHTQASYCGALMTRLRQEARQAVAENCGASEEHAVIFSGSGATSGINRLVRLFDVGPGDLVLIGPYEHHSNILPWRESGAEVKEIAEAKCGGPDTAILASALAAGKNRRCICSFSAASNVTGIITDVEAVTQLAKSAGALMIWDYAGGGPYLPITMRPAPGAEIDAVVISPHKFIGGPAASGILVVRRDAVLASSPTWPGGGTVRFVSPTIHDYSNQLEAREEAGTPNLIGDIRAALAFLVKDAMGCTTIEERNKQLVDRATATWSACNRIQLLGNLRCRRLPIFAFRVRDGKGGFVHQQLVTRMLSDRFGIQARGGCACAGPYVHRLLAIDRAASERIRDAILSGDEIEKPGLTRLNFSVLMSDEEASYIIDCVKELAMDAGAYVHLYACDRTDAIFHPHGACWQEPL